MPSAVGMQSVLANMYVQREMGDQEFRVRPEWREEILFYIDIYSEKKIEDIVRIILTLSVLNISLGKVRSNRFQHAALGV